MSVNYLDEDSRPLIASDEGQSSHSGSIIYKPYKRRFYILVVFGFLTFMQGLTWNTFGPLEDSTKLLFHWSTTITALMPNLGCISLVLTFPLIKTVYNKGGIRLCIILGGVFLSVGTAMRCVFINNTYFIVASTICAFLNGISGTFLNAIPSIIPALWFPDNERITATAFGLVLNMMGTAVSFLGGIYVIPNDAAKSPNYLPDMKQRLMNTMYMQFGASLFLTLCALIYYPSEPPTPPTRSADKPRVDIFEGFKDLIKSRNFWMLNGPIGLLLAVYYAYLALMATVLKPLGVSQDESGWIGFISSNSCIVGSLVIGKLTDQIKVKSKESMIIITALSVIASYWLLLMAYGTIPASKPCVYVASILICLLINSISPIFYDLLCETCFPVSEIVVVTVIVLYNNFMAVIFFFIVMIPGMDARFIIASVPCVALLCIPFMLFYSQNFKRFDIDREIEVTA